MHAALQRAKQRLQLEESYDQALADLYNNYAQNVTEPQLGEIVEGTLVYRDERELLVDTGKQTLHVELKHEQRFADQLRALPLSSPLSVLVLERGRGSVERAAQVQVERELLRTLHEQDYTCAFEGTLLEHTRNGFQVEVSGLRCFMPTSLAARNQVREPEALVGQTLPVVVVNHRPGSSVVVSHRHYVERVLPQRVQELQVGTQRYEGAVTGITKFGLFVQWDEVFTGLLHVNEMLTELAESYEQLAVGDTVSFYVKKVENPQRIVLSELPDVDQPQAGERA